MDAGHHTGSGAEGHETISQLSHFHNSVLPEVRLKDHPVVYLRKALPKILQ